MWQLATLPSEHVGLGVPKDNCFIVEVPRMSVRAACSRDRVGVTRAAVDAPGEALGGTAMMPALMLSAPSSSSSLVCSMDEAAHASSDALSVTAVRVWPALACSALRQCAQCSNYAKLTLRMAQLSGRKSNDWS